ncbi:MAG: hypothetical protein IT373_14825 [Polyangiaceae bacterium]|nr:hypothetical protein [Polyangiaceae bacterium]
MSTPGPRAGEASGFVMFEVLVTPGHEGEALLSDEVLETTAASVMTAEQAEKMGFHGIPADPEGRPRRFVVCAARDARLVQSRLEGSNACSGFQIHPIDL